MAGFTLRAFETDDAVPTFRMVTRPAVRQGAMIFAPYTTEVDGKAFMATPVNGANIVAVSDPGDAVIGRGVLIRNTQAMVHSGRVGLAVHDEWWRRGVGSALMAALIDTALNWLGMSRLTLEVFTDNEAAIGLYKKFGFEIEGTLRRHMFREGRFVDSYAMARLFEPPRLASGA